MPLNVEALYFCHFSFFRWFPQPKALIMMIQLNTLFWAYRRRFDDDFKLCIPSLIVKRSDRSPVLQALFYFMPCQQK